MASPGKVHATGVVELEKQDPEIFTNNFSSENFICQAQYCNLYHGKIPGGWKGLEGGDVTVKYELEFLQSPKATSSRYLLRLIALSRDDKSEFLGVVYDLRLSNTLRHFVDKVEFKWLERIKVAVGIARLLRYLIHEEPRYLVRDLSAAHIMLDKDWNPFLINYFKLDGVAMDSMQPEAHSDRMSFGSWGYIDIYYVNSGLCREYSDVFAFGVILCELLFKCKVEEHPGDGWVYIYNEAQELYPLNTMLGVSFVDKSLKKDPHFKAPDGPKISRLARLCVDLDPKIRPNMEQVVKSLENLQVVIDNVGTFTDI
ncbi:OLC1v1016257C1 [Oldenlandia corymbosa var. corymbosa]|uniref:OLC1v1016257C1 n=1 Tax=Oldenlandia corymbosa var. corymbosa TaxID=529605 RepID=A0AAV1E7C0_OLDCO|nr:OLC1v1016257C1 [Oldenlandia corymbosa var. corymbosa]